MRNLRGFTLLEMIVVLAILAAVATVAVRTIDGRVEQTRYESTQRQLRELEEAIIGPANQRQPDGTISAAGFVSDLGRLPHAIDYNSIYGPTDPLETMLQPIELWYNIPSPSLPRFVPFDIRPAVAANITLKQTLTHPTPTTFQLDLIAGTPEPVDDEVLVPSGWRGPYLRFSSSTSKLTDGYGSPFRMLKAGSSLLADPDTEAFQYQSWGANNLEDIPTVNPIGYDADVHTISMLDESHGAVSGMVEVLVKNNMFDDADTGNILVAVKVRLYSPDSNTGLIRLIELSVNKTVLNPPSDGPPVRVTIPYRFDAQVSTIGSRVVRAYYKEKTATKYTASNTLNIVVPRRGLITPNITFN